MALDPVLEGCVTWSLGLSEMRILKVWVLDSSWLLSSARFELVVYLS